MENNFFKKITNLVSSSNEEKEQLKTVKENLLNFLRGGRDFSDQEWRKFTDLAPKLTGDEEIQTAIKEGYLRALKEKNGEAIVIQMDRNEKSSNQTSFDQTYQILLIFEFFDYQKHKKGGYTGGRKSFIDSFGNNQEFLRLTKETLIRSLNEVDTSHHIIDMSKVLLPALIPDEVLKSIEVQDAARDTIIDSLQSNNLTLAIELQDYFKLPDEIIQSFEFQQAVQQAVQMREVNMKEMEKDPNHMMYIDSSSKFELQDKVEKIKGWITKKID